MSPLDLPPGAIGPLDTQVLLLQAERRHVGRPPLCLPELAFQVCRGRVRTHTAVRRLQREGLIVDTARGQRGSFAANVRVVAHGA